MTVLLVLSQYCHADEPLSTVQSEAFGPGSGSVSDAIEFFRRRVESRPRDYLSRLKLGSLYNRAAREQADGTYYDKAEDVLRQAAAINPEHAGVKAELARTLAAHHQFEKSLELALEAFKISPQAENLAIVGDAQWNLGRYDLADQTYTQLFKQTQTAPVLARLAQIDELFGRPEKAIERLRKARHQAKAASASDQELAWYDYRIGETQWRSGDVAGALEALELALELHPEDAATCLVLARIHAAEGRLAIAEKYCDKILSGHGDENALILLADIHAAEPDEQGARRLYLAAQESLENQQSDPVELKDFPPNLPTIKPATKHLATEPSAASGKSAEGHAHSHADHESHAHSDRYPDLHLRDLAAFYAERGWMKERAVDLARRDIATRQPVESCATLAWALYQNGDFQEAKEWIDKALKWKTVDAQLFYRAGVIHAALGLDTSASSLLQRAAKVNENFSLLESGDLRKRLKAIR